MKLLIANGYVVDPSQQINAGKNVLIDEGRITAILNTSDPVPEDARVFDATGLIVAPGFIDLHVHLREPGQEYKETIATGSASAVAGGWTSICAMPNTDPVNDNGAVTRFILEQGRAANLANVFPIGAATKGSAGKELAEMAEMKDAGIVAVSDDGHSIPSAGMMRRVMEYANGHDLTVVDHCQDHSLSAGGVMHEGRWSLILGMRGMPAAAEEADVLRDCALAKLTGASVHIAHVSTRGAIEAIRRAKQEGLKITCEVTPHHWTLSDAAVADYDTNTKMSPPLRSQEHLEAVWAGMADGTIDTVATDHAPHHADEKALEFDQAPFGIVGLETAVGLAFDLVHKGIIGLDRIVEMCSTNPARIFSLADRGSLKPNAHADITILDPQYSWVFDASKAKSKSKNSPFDGRAFQGASIATLVSGRLVYLHPDYTRVTESRQRQASAK
jgi:dihydroorotase